MLTTTLNISFAQGLAATGRSGEALSLIEETIRQVEANGDLCYMPELLRLKGTLVLAALQPRATEEAELCLRRSLELGGRQGTRAGELRTAVDLASLLAAGGRRTDARAVLRPISSDLGKVWEPEIFSQPHACWRRWSSMAMADQLGDRHHRSHTYSAPEDVRKVAKLS